MFGGGNVLKSVSAHNVGARNGEFVLRYLATEGIRVAARDLLQDYPRKVYYFPKSGRALVKALHLRDDAALVERETAYRRRLTSEPIAGEIDLF